MLLCHFPSSEEIRKKRAIRRVSVVVFHEGENCKFTSSNSTFDDVVEIIWTGEKSIVGRILMHLDIDGLYTKKNTIVE